MSTLLARAREEQRDRLGAETQPALQPLLHLTTGEPGPGLAGEQGVGVWLVAYLLPEQDFLLVLMHGKGITSGNRKQNSF